MNSVKITQLSVLTDSVTDNQVSTIAECSLANNGQQILVTGNWFASKSLNNGSTWSYINPFTNFPPADDGFCCDQTVLYDSKTDLTFWLLQYDKKNSINNTLRLAVKKGATLTNNNWDLWDFTPQSINPAWKNQWLDYNHAAVSGKFLYVCTNVFNNNDVFTRCIVLRIPLKALQTGKNVTFEYFESKTDFSLRCVQGATNTMYFAAHSGTTGSNKIRLFSWPENTASVSKKDIAITAWSGGKYRSLGPDGTNWLGRADYRITAAWLSNGVLGFMWTVNKRGTKRPNPHIRVVRMDAATMTLIDEPDIWSPDFSFGYPDAFPNSNGDVGITLFMGGGAKHPTHLVGAYDTITKNWLLKTARAGTNGPRENTWGDYITIRPLAPANKKWIAVGYTLQGGKEANDMEVHAVQFEAV
jgi:hypothetical protein